MFNKFSALVVFLILGLVAPIFASSSPCNCQTLPSHVGTIIGDLDELIDEVVSDVIEPVGSIVSSLVDDLLGSNGVVDDLLGSTGVVDDLLGSTGVVDDLLGSHGVVGGLLGSEGLLGGNGGLLGGDLLGSEGVVGGLLGSNGLDLDSVLGSNGIDLGDVISEVGDLVEDLLDIDSVDISLCLGLDLLQNNLFYKFNSGSNNHLVLNGFSSDIVLNVALFTGGCDDLACVYVDLDFGGNSNELEVVLDINTEYFIGVFGAPCDYIINYELSCHGRCH